MKRIQAAPRQLVLEIREENSRDGLAEKPWATSPIPEFYAAFEGLMHGMPKNLAAILEERLVGVFCVQGLGSSGYTEIVHDDNGDETYGIIVLDVGILRERTANGWATWKESSFFKKTGNPDTWMKVIIEEPQNDTVENAVRYILLHELGHVLGAVTKAHSSWLVWQRQQMIRMEYPFQANSWKLGEQGQVVSVHDELFPARKHVSAYAFDRSVLLDAQSVSVYEDLKRTDFVNLAASQNIWEDFTESFATYYHTVIDGRPWRIETDTDGPREVLFKTCWEAERCSAKRELIKSWIEKPFAFGRQ